MGLKLKEFSQQSDFFTWHGGSSLENQNCSKFETADIILDFTSNDGNQALYERFQENRNNGTFCLLIGSTGVCEKTKESWRSLAKETKSRILFAPNTSIGVLLTAKAAMMTALAANNFDFDIEIVETHHRRKIDQPSGTAKFLGESIASQVNSLELKENRTGIREKNEIGMHAIRGGGVFGEHEVRMISDDEEICISHRALSRDLFAKGALALGKWLLSRPAGSYELLDVTLEDLLASTKTLA